MTGQVKHPKVLTSNPTRLHRARFARTVAQIACLACMILCACANRAAGQSTRESADAVIPLPQAHAHNDYEHKRPLADALDHGFSSVEADIYLRDGRLSVAHDAVDLRVDRTLEAMYLEPLAARLKANGGRVYKNGPKFWLLVDLKSDGEPTYKALHDLLAKYRDILSTTVDDKHEERAVTVMISGNRPIKFITEQKTRYAGIDGRLADLDSDAPAHLMPMISDNWTLRFKWRGQGAMPADEQARLRSIVEKAHKRGRVVRFWATPEVPAIWRELRDAKVDLINTDKLAELREFLLSRPSKQR